MSIYTLIAADLLAITFLVFGLYFPRHRRRDMIVAFLAINVGVMGVTYAMATADVSLGFGLGIFAVLSIIRLRSTEMDHSEIAYYFTAIALGLLGGFPGINGTVGLTLMVILLLAMTIGDSPRLLGRARTQQVVLDRAVSTEAEAAELLDDLLNADIQRVVIRKTDLVQQTTVCDVRYNVRATADLPTAASTTAPERMPATAGRAS
ncbi:DUF4956 domain-containing protein [Demequina sp. B12]|uniref:DUF4956 domain-containing protein n=1 Tax=Demequina sp. B12 TaxID=2992757 RepID=UPI00237A8F8A|nr:DUF4956 domain-containing protein [Demequina sp. B12]MDE0572223.1 DUF4956 domain-containing protein [Demequina sp. B12]